jgi:hypothetical protein
MEQNNAQCNTVIVDRNGSTRLTYLLPASLRFSHKQNFFETTAGGKRFVVIHDPRDQPNPVLKPLGGFVCIWTADAVGKSELFKALAPILDAVKFAAVQQAKSLVLSDEVGRELDLLLDNNSWRAETEIGWLNSHPAITARELLRIREQDREEADLPVPVSLPPRPRRGHPPPPVGLPLSPSRITGGGPSGPKTQALSPARAPLGCCQLGSGASQENGPYSL